MLQKRIPERSAPETRAGRNANSLCLAQQPDQAEERARAVSADCKSFVSGNLVYADNCRAGKLRGRWW